MRVIRVDKASNNSGWILVLSCGHEVRVASKGPPTRKIELCLICLYSQAGKKRAEDETPLHIQPTPLDSLEANPPKHEPISIPQSLIDLLASE